MLIQLRSEPLTVSDDFKTLGLTLRHRPLKYIENDFENLGAIVSDHTTGLMWQKSGSDRRLNYKKAVTYVRQLNQEDFAGFNDWRLPTIEELTSLLEPIESQNGHHISLFFDEKQWWCWSADKHTSVSAWNVDFDGGLALWSYLNGFFYVRVCRS